MHSYVASPALPVFTSADPRLSFFSLEVCVKVKSSAWKITRLFSNQFARRKNEEIFANFGGESNREMLKVVNSKGSDYEIKSEAKFGNGRG